MSTKLKEISFKTNESFYSSNTIWFADTIEDSVKWWRNGRGHFNEQLYQQVVLSKTKRFPSKSQSQSFYSISDRITNLICKLMNY